MADITITPTGMRAVLGWAPEDGTSTSISVTLIGQSLSLAIAPSTALAFRWDENPVGRSLTLAQGTVTVVTIQNVSIVGQSLSLNVGVPLIYDFIATSRLLTLAQGTPNVIGDVGGTPSGQQVVLNQSPNIATDLSYTPVGQALALARGTPTTSLVAETIVSLVGQALSLSQGAPSIGSTVIIISPTSQIAHLTQSPNIVEERLLLLIGQNTLNLNQGIPTVNIVNNTAAATNVNIIGQALLLDKGIPAGVVASFIPVGRQLNLSIPLVVSRVDDREDIDGQALTLTQGTPTVVSIPGVTNIAGIPLVLNRGIPVVTVQSIVSVAGQTLALSQGAVSVLISADAIVSITGQQLILNQGIVSQSTDIDVFVFSLLLFLQQGTVEVQDAVNVSHTILGQQLNLSQGSITIVVSDEAVDVEILGQDLVLTRGSIHVISSTVDEEISQQGQQLILNQGSVCVIIYDMDEDTFDPAYGVESPFDTVEYAYGEQSFSPTYIPEHCD